MRAYNIKARHADNVAGLSLELEHKELDKPLYCSMCATEYKGR